jgi:phenylalanyl-tRNA synthetase alpha subunit
MVSQVMETDVILQDMSASAAVDKIITPDKTDLALPGYRRPLGSIHPVTACSAKLRTFSGLGFMIETGPEIESVLL